MGPQGTACHMGCDGTGKLFRSIYTKSYLLQAGINLKSEGHEEDEYTASKLFDALGDIYE